jgi:putative spermidine/putrescine transport system substrate-binding protein
MRLSPRLIALFTSSLLALGPTQAQDLTVVGFGGALQDTMRTTMFQPFAKATSTKLIEESYTGGIAKIKAMVQSKSTTWDVVQMDENEMILACDEGLLEKFNWATIPNAAEIADNAKAPCGVGAFVWSKVIAYDGAKVQGVNTWADFWDIKKWPGKRGLRKQARMTLEIALLADGVLLQDIYKVLGTKAGADRAFAKLDQIKPNIQWWESGAQPAEWLASGDVVMSSAYNGRIASANKHGKNFKMSWTNQLYAMDYWAIPKGDNSKLAFSLVHYMTTDEPQAKFAEVMQYGVTNRIATKNIDPKIQPLLPSAEANMATALAVSTPFWVDNEEALQQRFNTWVAK